MAVPPSFMATLLRYSPNRMRLEFVVRSLTPNLWHGSVLQAEQLTRDFNCVDGMPYEDQDRIESEHTGNPLPFGITFCRTEQLNNGEWRELRDELRGRARNLERDIPQLVDELGLESPTVALIREFVENELATMDELDNTIASDCSLSVDCMPPNLDELWGWQVFVRKVILGVLPPPNHMLLMLKEGWWSSWA